MVIYTDDIHTLQTDLIKLPKLWEGKTCVLELKDANYNWRQMEWWAFYFEYKVKTLLSDKFSFPGDRFDSVTFDLKGKINWDLKAKFLNADEYLYLNSKNLIEDTIAQCEFYGFIVAYLFYDYKNNNAQVESICSYVIDKQDLENLDLSSNYRGQNEKYVMNIDFEYLFESYKLAS